MGAVGASSDAVGEFGECRCNPVPGIDVDAEFVVAAAQVLDEAVSGADHPGRAEPFQPSHWPQPRFQPAVVGFDRVVRVLLGSNARVNLVSRSRMRKRNEPIRSANSMARFRAAWATPVDRAGSDSSTSV
jgi:hypothetical protein